MTGLEKDLSYARVIRPDGKRLFVPAVTFAVHDGELSSHPVCVVGRPQPPGTRFDVLSADISWVLIFRMKADQVLGGTDGYYLDDIGNVLTGWPESSPPAP